MEVLGNGAEGTGPTCLLTLLARSSSSSNNPRVRGKIFFNCGEATQRLCDEYGVKLSGTCPLFATMLSRSPTSPDSQKYIGGVPGLFMSLADRGAAKLIIRGPVGTKNAISNWQQFARRRYPEVNAVEVDAPARFERFLGDSVQVLSIRVRKSDPSTLPSGRACCHWCALDNREALQSESDEEESDEEESEDESEDGISEETSSEEWDTSTEDSVLVHLVRLKAPNTDDRDAVILFVDCVEGTEDQLASNPHMQFSCTNERHKPNMVYHFASRNVWENDAYQRWVNNLKSRGVIQHTLLANSNQRSVFRASDRMRRTLALAAPNMFPVRCGERKPAKRPRINGAAIPDRHIIFGSLEVSATNRAYDDANAPAFSELVRRAVDEDKDPNAITLSDESDAATEDGEAADAPSLTFLGTGCAKPSKLRGCSAILLGLSSNRYVLLDAGEGTYGQLVRLHGEARAEVIVRNLCFVWISHHHLDHHGGLGRIIEVYCKAHATGGKRSLTVVAPQALHRTVQASPQISLYTAQRARAALQRIRSTHPEAAGCLQDMRCTQVIHCRDAWAIALDLNFSIPTCLVYSGDTRPCPRRIDRLFESASKRQRVLIHEATFEHELLDQARRKRHSTTKEALDVAAAVRGGVDVVFLTHFSQRYPSVGSHHAESKGSRSVVVAASDLMSVPLFGRTGWMGKIAKGSATILRAFAKAEAGKKGCTELQQRHHHTI